MWRLLTLGIPFLLSASQVIASGVEKEVVTKVLSGPTSEIQLPTIKVGIDMDKLRSSDSLGASEILAGLAVLVSIGALCFQAYQFNKQKKSSIKEAFWMREVIIPRFLNRFLDFIEQAPEYYQSANNLTDFYQDYALLELNMLRDATELLNVGKRGLGEKVVELLLNFDDDVTEQVHNVSDLSMLLNELASKVIKEIQIAQEKIS
ncbi:hypothetical protein NB501_04495 [Vibrio alginolyticus]|uniref:hypothetical protein n=1 Tax=Vibrio alginolyticus TaxID=663 RepID=UPI00215CC887|nr:hypothetical protein [Vibrio alginolyticus]ELB2881598.1 hypothetical protein [Vibrio alginolyticus]MCR9574704.1 hypothetical protein [Vibrio alginolyticus]